jgi:hypothetical protein
MRQSPQPNKHRALIPHWLFSTHDVLHSAMFSLTHAHSFSVPLTDVFFRLTTPCLALDSSVHLKSTSSCARALARSLASCDRISQYSPVTEKRFILLKDNILISMFVTLISDRSILVPGDKDEINLVIIHRESSSRSLQSRNITSNSIQNERDTQQSKP